LGPEQQRLCDAISEESCLSVFVSEYIDAFYKEKRSFERRNGKIS